MTKGAEGAIAPPYIKVGVNAPHFCIGFKSTLLRIPSTQYTSFQVIQLLEVGLL